MSIASNHFSKNDVVKIVVGSKWASGGNVPSWVVAKEWIVSEASTTNETVVIDKSVDGKNSICSPINYKFLTLVNSSDKNSTSSTATGLKYSATNPPIVCMQTQSTCYKETEEMTVRGILWHSTGANNKSIKRYVQPSDNDPNRDKLIKLIGKNKYNNDWNHVARQAGLNAWIGTLADDTVASVQTMPWTFKPWGCGARYKDGPSCNDGWIQFEICEDSLQDPVYFNKVYKEACELTAYLCKLFKLDPKGTVNYKGVKVPVILCHADSYDLGLGSNHGDIDHWFPKFGKSMKTVRNDVAKLLAEDTTEEELYVKGYVTKVSTNFKSTEFDCSGKNCCSTTVIDSKLVEYLQKIRDHFNQPLYITSGYRCLTHNKSVGGSADSLHTKGQAADIYIKNIDPVEIARYAESIGILGIGLYETDADGYFVHIDTRSIKSFWYGKSHEARTTFQEERRCSHNKTKIVNQKSATCSCCGYTGDIVCTSCGDIVESGSSVSKLEHKYILEGKIDPTIEVEGYTGDQVCSLCGHTIKGETISKLSPVVVTPSEDEINITIKKSWIKKLIDWLLSLVE